jgi:hypothetical protein
LPPWYLPNGTIYASDDQLEEGTSSCELWGIACAVIVVLSVVFEFVLAIFHPPYDSPWQRWGSAVADALIALGIIGEVLFGMWSGHIQTELRDRSNKRVADSALRAAEANERAAEAQLALEKLRMPRSLTVEQQESITEAMKPFAGQKFEGEVASGVPDAIWLWYSIAKALTDAGWIRVTPPGVTVGDPPANISIYAPTGIGVGIPTSSRPSSMERGLKLVMALGAAKIRAGIAFDEQNVIPHYRNPDRN